jgi:hypothetical protein
MKLMLIVTAVIVAGAYKEYGGVGAAAVIGGCYAAYSLGRMISGK